MKSSGILLSILILFTTLTLAQDYKLCWANCGNEDKKCRLTLPKTDCMNYRFECNQECN